MDSLYNIFAEYGWAGINAVIICIVLFYGGRYAIKKLTNNMHTGLEDVGEKLTDKMAEQNDKLADQLATQNETLVKTIVDQQGQLLGHLLDNRQHEQKNHNEMLGERMALTEEIKDGLKDIGHIHGAQRVFIVEFHNSNQNLSGTPFAKWSCTYEWCEKNVSSVQFTVKDLPFSGLSGAITKIYNSHEQQLIYEKLEDLLDDCPALRDLFTKYPCDSIICTAMYDRDNVLIGALILEFIGTDMSKVNLNQLHIQAAELTSLINVRYKYLK